MKIMIFDVSNASCALVVDNNGNSMMIDAGSNSEKECPTDLIHRNKDSYLKLQKEGDKPIIHTLIITHPDDDHIRNLEKIKDNLEVKSLIKACKIEEFKDNALSDGDSLKYYEKNYCKHFIGDQYHVPYLFSYKNYNLPISYVNNNFEDSKITNNSSVVTLIEYSGKKILFGGDLEEDGREYLIDNNHNGFVDDVFKGIDLFVVPHHGHKSGYSQKLFETIGDVKLSILSKGSEFEKEGTDVSSSYTNHSISHSIYDFGRNFLDRKKTLTTRNNGLIVIEIDEVGNITPLVEKQGN